MSVSLVGSGVVLEPLTHEHAPSLVAAASDGELWNLKVTVVPDAAKIAAYIAAALKGRDAGTVLPFTIKHAGQGTVLGSTRYWKVDAEHRKLEIGYTWLAKTWQGTFVNPAIKYLMLCHAFEQLNCVRVQFQTDERNAHSRAAILRLGAKEEGILRHERIMPDGHKRNSVRFSLIDLEWPEAKAKLERRLAALNIHPSYSIR